jgi:hypothetical protein
LIEAGAVEQGVALVRSAIALEPRLSISNWMLARTHLLRGEGAEALTYFREEPKDQGQAVYWLNRSRIALWTRDRQFALEWLPKLQARGDVPPGALAFLGMLASERPIDRSAMASVDRSSTGSMRAKRRRTFFCQIRAEIAGFLGDAEGSLRAIVDADDASLFDVSWLEGCPLLGSVRADPGYAAVHARIDARAKTVRRVFDLP